VSQNSSQSVAELYAAALAAKLGRPLSGISPQETEESASSEPSADPAEAAPAEAEASAPRVSRKEARARLKLRLEGIPDFARHSRKCQICNHPDIEELEEEYINWASAHWITETFELSDESTIYRHARATGLDVVRRENLGVALEKIVQEVDHLETPTVAEVLRAVRTLARINSRGQWVFPPAFENSNRQTYEELEIGASGTKQTPEVISNRQT
jgi:hypothetical protein